MIDSSLSETKENQFFFRDKIQPGLKELWKRRKKPIEIIFLGTIISLVAIVFINSELAFRLIFLLDFFAVFTYSFIRIIIFEDLEDKEDENKPEPPAKLSWWL